MGFLKDTGQTFSFKESQSVQKFIKEQGIVQLLKIYQKFKDFQLDKCQILWGDEIEFHILKLDHDKKTVKLDTVTCQDLFTIFKEIEDKQVFEIQPEYGAWMVETIPKTVFQSACRFTPTLENNIARRTEISKLLPENSIILAIPVFPMFGVRDYFIPPKLREESAVR